MEFTCKVFFTSHFYSISYDKYFQFVFVYHFLVSLYLNNFEFLFVCQLLTKNSKFDDIDKCYQKHRGTQLEV